jgi:hypothetical protein
MNRRSAIPIVVISASLVLLAACNKKEEEPKFAPSHSTMQGGASSSVAGISWTVPAAWKDEGPRQMRVATYTIPGSGGAGDAECAVFYFGSDQGGNIDANISRWESQFDGSPMSKRSAMTVHDMEVTKVMISGTYLAPGGPQMESQGKMDDYRLLGSIVKGPQGSVFFKITGPAATVDNAEQDFDSMMKSLTKS